MHFLIVFLRTRHRNSVIHHNGDLVALSIVQVVAKITVIVLLSQFHLYCTASQFPEAFVDWNLVLFLLR